MLNEQLADRKIEKEPALPVSQSQTMDNEAT